MKPINRLLILANLALLLVLAQPARAQLFGHITDAPQHVVGAGGGCDGNRQCSADAMFLEKLTGATYSLSMVEFVPTTNQVVVPAPLGSSANLTTATTKTVTNISVKSIASEGVEQVLAQTAGGRLTFALGGAPGVALPSPGSPSFNFSVGEHASMIARINKTLNTAPGGTNWYMAVTGYFTQIMGVDNGQTWAVRVNFLHGANGGMTAATAHKP